MGSWLSPAVAAPLLSACLVCACICRRRFSGLPSRPLSFVEPLFQLRVLSLFMSSLVPVSFLCPALWSS